MARPSDPLLAWLRRLIETKNTSVADVAARAGIDRSHLRKVLQGAEPMTLDELQLLSQALEIQPSDFGLAGGAEVPDEPPVPAAPRVGADPWGNQPEQLFRMAFDLGCDFYFTSDSAQLADSGVPKSVLERNPRELGIKMDAAYHRYNEPKYSPAGVTLTLSFDALYTCTFPWTAIRQVVFWPAPPEAQPVTPEPPPTDPEPRKGSHLRLVT
jgi:transcriptional regulator with XRE-family HTH domain